MSFDPTQQVPPPAGYPSQPPYQPPAYPPPQPTAPPTYPQYSSQPVVASGAGFDFNAFWRSLGLVGQVAGIAGLFIFICFLFPWFSSPTDSYNGFSSASGSFSGISLNLFPYLWLVLLGALGLIALTWLISRRRFSSGTTTVAVIATTGVMLALEICFLTETASFAELSGRSNSGGAAVGFWLAALATAAALGTAIYTMIQQRKVAGSYQPLPAPPYGAPYQPPVQYPGSQPYQPPPQYPGSQPPQYPGQ